MGRGGWNNIKMTGYLRKGATVGVAWDAENGALLVGIDGAALAPLFSEGVEPGPAVGAGLFPALSGVGRCRVLCNLGCDLQRRPFRHEPPAGFLPCAASISSAPDHVTACPVHPPSSQPLDPAGKNLHAARGTSLCWITIGDFH